MFGIWGGPRLAQGIKGLLRKRKRLGRAELPSRQGKAGVLVISALGQRHRRVLGSLSSQSS